MSNTLIFLNNYLNFVLTIMNLCVIMRLCLEGEIMKLTDKKQITGLIWLFTFTYMISYITRINYGAIISEMERSTGMARSLLSMALTGSFITYGAGQIISGVLGDKFSPKKLVSFGFIITIVMNILIPFCSSPYLMLIIWCINGFAQSLMWPPIVKLMAILLPDEDYGRASVKISWGSSFGTIFVYLSSPLLISFAGWKSVFFSSAVMAIIMLLIWNKFCLDIKPEEKKAEVKKKNTSMSSLFTPVMICIMLSIVLQGMLRDGVTTWMPSYISETYNLSSVISILTGVILPLFSILSFQAASTLHKNTFKNPVTCAGVIFALGTLSALGLYFSTGHSAAISVLLSALLTGCMHGVNLMLICMVPAFFKKQGNVSTVSGIINSCTYIGSAISTYGIALLSESFGWSFTLFIWLLIALSGTLLCFISAKGWYRNYQSK